MHNPMTESVVIPLSEEEMHGLRELASLSGLTLTEYVRAKILSESSAEEQFLRLLSEELAAIGRDVVEANAAHILKNGHRSTETKGEQRARIAKEVRDSLTDGDLEALAAFFKPAFTASPAPRVVSPKRADEQ